MSVRRRRKRRKGKVKTPPIAILESSKGSEFLRLSGRALEKGRSGLNVMVFRSQFGDNFSVGLSPWGQDTLVFVPVESDAIEYDEEEGIVSITINLHMPEDADFEVIDEFLEEAEEYEEYEEEEEEEAPVFRKRKRGR